MSSKGRRWNAWAALAAVLLTASPTLGQITGTPPLREADGNLVLDAAGHSLTMPLPDWLDPDTAGAVIGQVEAHFTTADGEAQLEIYPKGEAGALWRTLYGARVTEETGRTLADYRQLIMTGYAQSCRSDLTGFFQLGEDQGDQLAPLGFVCGGYRSPTFADEGEVMVMSFRKTDRGLAVVYQEWRGDAFDPRQPASWPVSTATVQARALQLQSDAALALLP